MRTACGVRCTSSSCRGVDGVGVPQGARLAQDHPRVSAWQRYANANGDLLAAGVAYFAFFSIFPALALAFAIFGFVLQGQPELLDTIADSLNTALPGMVKTADNPEGIISLSAPTSLTLTITGIIAFVTLLLAGLGWVGALRTGIRAVFGLKATIGNVATSKLRDLGVLSLLGVLIAVSAILSSAIGASPPRSLTGSACLAARRSSVLSASSPASPSTRSSWSSCSVC